MLSNGQVLQTSCYEEIDVPNDLLVPASANWFGKFGFESAEFEARAAPVIRVLRVQVLHVQVLKYCRYLEVEVSATHSLSLFLLSFLCLGLGAVKKKLSFGGL